MRPRRAIWNIVCRRMMVDIEGAIRRQTGLAQRPKQASLLKVGLRTLMVN